MTGQLEVMRVSGTNWCAGPTVIEAAVVSSRSGCSRATEMLCVYPLASHTAREDNETDPAMRTCVPQPSASVPTRYHGACCALQAAVGCVEHSYCDGSFPRRRLGPPAGRQGDGAAFHVALGAVESRRAARGLASNRDSWPPWS